MDTNYSIIIPHKNIPTLLQRCLDSIPIRDDIQVIVIDDCSDSNIVDFDHFPLWKGNKYVTIFSKEEIFAGGARNEGLKQAIGKWLFFLDADDLLTEQANDIFDRYKNHTSESIIFGIESRICETLQLIHGEHWYMHTLRKCSDPQAAMLSLTTSCAKFIKREIVVSNKIQFSLCKHHNDTLFFTKVGIASTQIECYPNEVIYIWTFREGSISHTINSLEIHCHFYTDLEKYLLIKKAGLNKKIGNCQIEHLHKIKYLSINEQIPILYKMFISGMLFNKTSNQPLSTYVILKKVILTMWCGLKNSYPRKKIN